MAIIKILKVRVATSERTSMLCGFGEYIFKTLTIGCHAFVKLFGIVLALSIFGWLFSIVFLSKVLLKS